MLGGLSSAVSMGVEVEEAIAPSTLPQRITTLHGSASARVQQCFGGTNDDSSTSSSTATATSSSTSPQLLQLTLPHALSQQQQQQGNQLTQATPAIQALQQLPTYFPHPPYSQLYHTPAPLHSGEVPAVGPERGNEGSAALSRYPRTSTSTTGGTSASFTSGQQQLAEAEPRLFSTPQRADPRLLAAASVLSSSSAGSVFPYHFYTHPYRSYHPYSYGRYNLQCGYTQASHPSSHYYPNPSSLLPTTLSIGSQASQVGGISAMAPHTATTPPSRGGPMMGGGGVYPNAIMAGSDGLLGKQNKQRVLFSPFQVQALERHYQREHFINAQTRTNIALELGLTPAQVKIWYQNRRYKAKKQKKDIEYGLRQGLKTANNGPPYQDPPASGDSGNKLQSTPMPSKINQTSKLAEIGKVDEHLNHNPEQTNVQNCRFGDRENEHHAFFDAKLRFPTVSSATTPLSAIHNWAMIAAAAPSIAVSTPLDYHQHHYDQDHHYPQRNNSSLYQGASMHHNSGITNSGYYMAAAAAAAAAGLYQWPPPSASQTALGENIKSEMKNVEECKSGSEVTQ